MTDLTDEAVKALLDGATPGPWAYEPHGDTGDYGVGVCYAMSDIELAFPLSGQVDSDVMVYDPICPEVAGQGNAAIMAAAPDLARALLDARAELARVKADAAVAVALVVERAVDALEGQPRRVEPLGGQSTSYIQLGEAVTAIRALAPADGLAAVEALRAEVERATSEIQGFRDLARENMRQWGAAVTRAETAEAELVAAQQREAALTKALEACVASLERVDTAEGVCCCGDSMDRHSDPMSCGHSPVDMGDYYAGQALESARAALAQTPTDPGDGWTWHERLGWIGPDGKPADPRRRG